MKKVILITGGSEGLGKEIARKLVSQNQVVILSSDADKLAATAKELGCDFLTCDVTKLDQIEHTINQVMEKYKKIDVLINNAGIWIEGELDSNEPEYVKKVLEVNTLGTIWMTRMVLPHMKKAAYGRIINVISQAGKIPKAERSVYSASKFAITGFTESLQLEQGRYGIAVSGVYPYKMKTKMFEKVGIKKSMEGAVEPAVVAEAVVSIAEMELPDSISGLMIQNIGYK